MIRSIARFCPNVGAALMTTTATASTTVVAPPLLVPQWSFDTKNSGFITMNDKDSAAVEAAYSSATGAAGGVPSSSATKTTLQLSNGQQYIFSFASMTQRNASSKAKRRLQRNMVAAAPSVSANPSPTPQQVITPTTTATTTLPSPAAATLKSALGGYKIKSHTHVHEYLLPYTVLLIATGKVNFVVDGLEDLSKVELSKFCANDKNRDSQSVKRHLEKLVQRRIVFQVKRHGPIGEQLALLEYVAKAFRRSRLNSRN